jgi:hypothetical protein
MSRRLLGITFAFILALNILIVSAYADVYETPVPAEVTEEKAFVRENHGNKAKRVATLEEGDGLDLLEEWQGSDSYPWYKVKIDGVEGWIYGQVVRRLDGGTAQTQPAASEKSKSIPEVGLLADKGDFVTVVARGQGTVRQNALNAAWIDAVRFAVGTIISSKSELNNDEFAESTIAHSRGVIDSFDILDEQKDGKRTTVTIQAKVHKEILKDATKTYAETQTVKADTDEAVKVQMNVSAKDATAEDKQKSGMALLQEVLETYGKPELFYSAALDPKIYYDKAAKKSYVKIAEKFNEDMFWKEFLPKLRNALDGVAEKKVKKNYSDESRKSNQNLAKNKRVREGFKNYSNKTVYSWNIAGDDFFQRHGDPDVNRILLFVPENNSSFTAYILPYTNSREWLNLNALSEHSRLKNLFEGVSDFESYKNILEFINKMSHPVVFYVNFVDKDGNEIYSQPIKRVPPLPTVFRSVRNHGNYTKYEDWSCSPSRIGLAPGFVVKLGNNNNIDVVLDTKGSEMRVDLELDADDLQKVDSMKFEVVFEQW